MPGVILLGLFKHRDILVALDPLGQLLDPSVDVPMVPLPNHCRAPFSSLQDLSFSLAAFTELLLALETCAKLSEPPIGGPIVPLNHLRGSPRAHHRGLATLL